MTTAEDRLRRALRTSVNRHWLARLVIGFWALHLPMVAMWAPQSMAGRALAAAGGVGVLGMLLLALLASMAILDSAINDAHLLPSRFTQLLMAKRHVGFMLLAIVLTITGGGIAVHAKVSVVLASFLTPAVFCVAVTYADLFGRHQRRGPPS